MLMGAILSILIGPVLRRTGCVGPVVVVGGGPPLEILSRHAATDDAGQGQRRAIDLQSGLRARLALRTGVIVCRFDPFRPRFRVVFHAVPCSVFETNRHEAARESGCEGIKRERAALAKHRRHMGRVTLAAMLSERPSGRGRSPEDRRESALPAGANPAPNGVAC